MKFDLIVFCNLNSKWEINTLETKRHHSLTTTSNDLKTLWKFCSVHFRISSWTRGNVYSLYAAYVMIYIAGLNIKPHNVVLLSAKGLIKRLSSFILPISYLQVISSFHESERVNWLKCYNCTERVPVYFSSWWWLPIYGIRVHGVWWSDMLVTKKWPRHGRTMYHRTETGKIMRMGSILIKSNE